MACRRPPRPPAGAASSGMRAATPTPTCSAGARAAPPATPLRPPPRRGGHTSADRRARPNPHSPRAQARRPARAGYVKAARAACDSAGALLVLDEIQSGIGRTGAWFACQGEGVLPDVITLAKGLGGGLPIGACVGIGAAGSALGRGDHGSTFGGNPVACAAAPAVLPPAGGDGLLGNAPQAGAVMSPATAD